MKREEVAAIMIAIQIGESVIIWGPPGGGKSEMIRGGMAKLGYFVWVIRINMVLPHHLSGSPLPSPDGNSVRYVPPSWVLALNSHPKSLLFLDDISCAGQANQTAALGLMDEKESGGVKFNAVTIGAANPSTLATPRFELDAAVSSRAIHILVTDDADTFAEDAEADFPPPNVPSINPNWEANIPAKRKLMLNFLRSSDGRDLVNAMPEQITMKTVSWPCRRTWKKCWRLWAACDAVDPASLEGADIREIRSILFRGAVGEATYKKFLNHYITPMQGNVEEALRHGKAYSFPEDGDELFGLLAAVSSRLRKGYDQKGWKQAWSLLEGVWQTAHRDRAVTFALDLVSLKTPDFDLPEFYTKTVRPVLQVAH